MMKRKNEDKKPMHTDYNSYHPAKREMAAVFAAGYGGIFLISALFYHSLLLSAVCGLGGAFLIRPYRRYMVRRRQAQLGEQFRDLLLSLESGVAAGHSLVASMEEGLEHLRMIHGEQGPLVLELEALLRSIQEHHGREEELWRSLALRSGLKDIREFVQVYTVCRETGGDLTRAIGTASRMITDKMTIQREIQALTAQKRWEAKVITVMPVAVLALLQVASPDYLATLYTTLAGRLVMSLALAGMGVAYVIMEKMGRIAI